MTIATDQKLLQSRISDELITKLVNCCKGSSSVDIIKQLHICINQVGSDSVRSDLKDDLDAIHFKVRDILVGLHRYVEVTDAKNAGLIKGILNQISPTVGVFEELVNNNSVVGDDNEDYSNQCS